MDWKIFQHTEYEKTETEKIDCKMEEKKKELTSLLENYSAISSEISMYSQNIATIINLFGDKNPNGKEYFVHSRQIYYFDSTDSYTNSNTHCHLRIEYLSPQHLFSINGLPYVDNTETLTIYRTICKIIDLVHSRQEVEYNCWLSNTKRLAKYYSKKTVAESFYTPLLKKQPLYQAILEYYISCYPDRKTFSVHPILFNPEFYYILNKNLIFSDYEQNSTTYLLTDKTIIELFKQKKLMIPDNKCILRNLFSSLKTLVAYNSKTVYYTTACNSLTFNNIDSYFFYFVYKEKQLFLYKTASQLMGYHIPINTTLEAHISEQFRNYISELVCQDINSLRTLAKIVAALCTPYQPFKKLIVIENKKYAQMNLSFFLKTLLKCSVSADTRLSGLCAKKKLLNTFSLQSFINYCPSIYFTSDAKISKLTPEKQSMLKKLINGSTIYIDDSILTKLYYHNYAPIIFFSKNENDYSFLEKHFACAYLKINPDCLPIPKLTPNDFEWFKRIFIPWGRELLFNGHLDITKKKIKKQLLPSTSIEEFMTIFTHTEENATCYPEDVYASYKRFFEHTMENRQICTKGGFIKLLKESDKYIYGRKHIRASKKHPASNRYAFKNLVVDTEKLDTYLQNKPIPVSSTENPTSTLENELNLITEHYQKFFDTAINPDTNEKIKMQHKTGAKIVQVSPTEQSKTFEKIQKVTKTIEH